MHDLDDAWCGERAGQVRQVSQCQGIDTARVAARGHLHQTELGAIGALPQEFSIEPDGGKGFQMRAKLGKSGGCSDYGLQRFSI